MKLNAAATKNAAANTTTSMGIGRNACVVIDGPRRAGCLAPQVAPQWGQNGVDVLSL
jgi:AMMECR1 domain-containing protein